MAWEPLLKERIILLLGEIKKNKFPVRTLGVAVTSSRTDLCSVSFHLHTSRWILILIQQDYINVLELWSTHQKNRKWVNVTQLRWKESISVSSGINWCNEGKNLEISDVMLTGSVKVWWYCKANTSNCLHVWSDAYNSFVSGCANTPTFTLVSLTRPEGYEALQRVAETGHLLLFANALLFMAFLKFTLASVSKPGKNGWNAANSPVAGF